MLRVLCLAAATVMTAGLGSAARVRLTAPSERTRHVHLFLDGQQVTYVLRAHTELFHRDAEALLGDGSRIKLGQRKVTAFYADAMASLIVVSRADGVEFGVRGVFVLPNGTLVAVQPVAQALFTGHDDAEHSVTVASFNWAGLSDAVVQTSPLTALRGERRDLYNASSPGPIKFTPNCYTGDAALHTLQVTIAVDVSYQAELGSTDPQTIIDEVQAAVGVSRIAYKTQLNVAVQIKQLYIASAVDDAGTVLGQPSCAGVLAVLSSFSSWLAQTGKPLKGIQDAAAFVAFTGCSIASGITGIANVGGVCAQDVNTAAIARGSAGGALGEWLVFAHELGHVLGAQHTFQNGVGTTGGIMDYSNGQYLGEIQFHPYARTDLCTTLGYTVASQCPYFFLTPASALCGDGVLSADEDCECLGYGNQSCAACVNCTLAEPHECSLADFVVRAWTTADDVVVSADLLSDAGCCDPASHRLAGPKTTCTVFSSLFNQWETNDVCSVGGKCASMCYLWDMVPCGFDASGCAMGCSYEGRACDFTQHTSTLNISAVPDYTPCVLQSAGAGGTGVCLQQACVGTDTLSGGLDAFTFAPTPPTASPSRVPTAPTSLPTARPTLKPVVTKSPTSLQPTRPPTARPTRRPVSSSPSSSSRAPSPSSRAPSALSTPGPTALPSVSITAAAGSSSSNGQSDALMGLMAVPLLFVGAAVIVAQRRKRAMRAEHLAGALGVVVADNPQFQV